MEIGPAEGDLKGCDRVHAKDFGEIRAFWLGIVS
jgi:hypothetical protein